MSASLVSGTICRQMKQFDSFIVYDNNSNQSETVTIIYVYNYIHTQTCICIQLYACMHAHISVHTHTIYYLQSCKGKERSMQFECQDMWMVALQKLLQVLNVTTSLGSSHLCHNYIYNQHVSSLMHKHCSTPSKFHSDRQFQETY